MDKTATELRYIFFSNIILYFLCEIVQIPRQWCLPKLQTVYRVRAAAWCYIVDISYSMDVHKALVVYCLYRDSWDNCIFWCLSACLIINNIFGLNWTELKLKKKPKKNNSRIASDPTINPDNRCKCVVFIKVLCLKCLLVLQIKELRNCNSVLHQCCTCQKETIVKKQINIGRKIRKDACFPIVTGHFALWESRDSYFIVLSVYCYLIK